MGGSLPLGLFRAPGGHAGRRCLLGIMIAYHSVFGESNYAPSIYRKPSQQHLAGLMMFTSPLEVNRLQPGHHLLPVWLVMDCGALRPLQPLAVVCMVFDHHPALHVLLPLPAPPLGSSEWLSSPWVRARRRPAICPASRGVLHAVPVPGPGSGP